MDYWFPVIKARARWVYIGTTSYITDRKVLWPFKNISNKERTLESLCLVAIFTGGETLFMVLLPRNLRIIMPEMQDLGETILLVKRSGILQIIPRSFPISEG